MDVGPLGSAVHTTLSTEASHRLPILVVQKYSVIDLGKETHTL